MNAMSQNHSDFAARMKRIEMGAKTQTLFVGVDEVYQVKRREKLVKLSRGQRLVRKIAVPFTVLMALAVGVASHAAGRVAMFHINGMSDPKVSAQIDMLEQWVIGFGIAMLLSAILGLRSGRATVMSLAGAACGVLLFHNAVHLYPDFFELVTSPAWVDQITGGTRFHSILWGGTSIPF